MKMDGKTKTVAQTLGLVLVMGGLAWASVPFYDWFCRVTGYGGATNTAEAGADTVLDREITIRFDGSLERGMPWEFKPVETEVTLKIGETGLAFYEAYNPTDEPIAGSASYNVAPYDAGNFFTKIDCFCFEEQVLQPGERVQMPVTFYVDPAIVDDRDAKFVNHITLSYTFYQIDLPQEQAALDLN
ncbi:cytochrome c oxidase assembly protein subunit 11 [Palleronia salina]|uniref:Cytochrome c oxidase assembly protein CtaG n=2 Tax=Palleronia TaxID=315422 RepID=A0A1M6GZZ1_9RHOB|nr:MULTISPECIES: cytochrome c oxidase assembly protein [Palleronia]SEN09037.1 cytochrome c oxidase assembly protein subunit 11 [Palleronia pelagia]SHJ15508.1 cytochrome c oxidase assembly protein subunit 11 [Palleronia salina]